jgi:hypothetical protein
MDDVTVSSGLGFAIDGARDLRELAISLIP